VREYVSFDARVAERERKRNACVVTATPATEIPAPLAEARLLAALYGRRSWKPAAMDPEREVPEPLVGALLDAACQAPTHGLIEPWRFLVFTGPGRGRLAAQLPSVYDAVTPVDQMRTDKRDKLGVIFLQAPVVIVLACHHPPGCKIPLLENQLAVACAVQNLHLAAQAAGLAAMWSSPPLVSTEAARPVLDLDPHELALGFFFVGWPKAGAPSPVSTRRPWIEKTRWIRH
jgi:nitroreductase